jgi:uncharacterized protein YfkK (UPF0435 family)
MVFKFRALSGDVENFARDYEISEENTLFDLHQLIQSDLNFDSSQMASFFAVDHEWNKLREFTLFELGEEADDMEDAPVPMDVMTLKELVKEKNQRLLYTFDIYSDRSLFLEVLEHKKAEAGVKYPIVTYSVGEPPFQIDNVSEEDSSIYDDVMEDFDDFESYEDYNERLDDEF